MVMHLPRLARLHAVNLRPCRACGDVPGLDKLLYRRHQSRLVAQLRRASVENIAGSEFAHASRV